MAPERTRSSRPTGWLWMPLIFGLIIGSTLAATTDQWWWTTVAVIVAAGIAVAGYARTAKRDHS